jgi:O-acetyl-ADP-ribose deacetylase (regulator of RNase III)
MVHYVKGDLLESNVDYICHQVNCQGIMGSGIARQIRERWPEVYEVYRKTYMRYEQMGIPPEYKLGNVERVYIDNGERERCVVNMYSQRAYGYDGRRYTSYDAFAECLNQINAFCPDGSTIGFPKNIGCGLGGGNWKVISALIEEILGDEFEIYIYEYEGA